MVWLLLLGFGAGCQALFPPGSLPAVPYHQLPSTVARLHRLADGVVKRSRAMPDLVRARSALRKADFVQPDNYETLWRLARVDGILARLDTRRGGEWAGEGLAAATRARKLGPQRPEGHLYWAVCAGLLAKSDPTQADNLLKELVSAAEKSRMIDSDFGNGEARRTLGATYLYAPPWPSGVGDLDEAIEVLEKLAKDHPQDPMNLFFLAEAYRKADQRSDAVRLYKKVRAFKPLGTWKMEGPPYRRLSRRYILQLRRSR